ncbi:putative transposase, mutator type, MULE transposase domain-containing protein [Helianthus annuus]|nr:putative transposase, mutator type, MULE transposase domain-containing protein [Helianthus annuus]KAJ0920447.1 putative transposase, mutator type, MULE transposase domain-containing protein [Helianthus annuus]
MNNGNDDDGPSIFDDQIRDSSVINSTEVGSQTTLQHEDDQIEKDPFLSLLCYDSDSEKDDRVEKDDEASSAEDWSANEKDYDSDGVENIERDVVYPSYDPTINWRLTKPILGMKFESPTQLKESLIDYGVSNGYKLEFTVNDYRRLLVVCGEEKTEDKEDHSGKKKKVRTCPFRLWASRLTGEDSFQIKTLNEKHTCTRKYCLGSLVTYSWIAKRYFKQIVENPEISLRQMQTDIMRKFECKVSIGQCSRAKKKVLDDYEGGLKEHYARLSDYKAEILETNPGSTVMMAVNQVENGEVYFSSYYICFKGVKDGWINGCRKVLGLDGCFLKNSGQLLTAMGRDANNHIFPLAWAVVSVENKENWKWFLSLVRDDIEMESGLGLTLISDQHKGIIEAVKDVFPYAEHRQCVRHIYANYKKKYRGEQFKNLFWKAANATTEEYFEKKMEELKNINKGAYTHLMERNPVTWSKAFFELNKACDAYENGMSESFNSRILSARRKPIITMLEEIRTFVMERIFLMAKKAGRLKRDVCPKIRKKLEKIKENQRYDKSNYYFYIFGIFY